MKKILYITTEIGLSLSILIFCIAGIAGIPVWPKQETSVGYFHISKNAFGIAIYQDKAHASLQFGGVTEYHLNGNTISFAQPTQAPILITYSRDDIIFDKDGTVYTEPMDSEMKLLSETTSIPMKKDARTNEELIIETTSLFIVNPYTPGAVELHAPNQTPIDFVLNRNTKTLTTKNEIKVRVMDTIPNTL